MIKDGLLDKHGKKNEKTPTDWTSAYVDYRYRQDIDVMPLSVVSAVINFANAECVSFLCHTVRLFCV